MRLKFLKWWMQNAPKVKLALWLSNLQTKFKKTSLLVLLQLYRNQRDLSSTSLTEPLPHPNRIQDTTIRWAFTLKMTSKLMKKIKKAVAAMMQPIKCLCPTLETERPCKISQSLKLRQLRTKKRPVSQRVKCSLIQAMKIPMLKLQKLMTKMKTMKKTRSWTKSLNYIPNLLNKLETPSSIKTYLKLMMTNL